MANETVRVPQLDEAAIQREVTSRSRLMRSTVTVSVMTGLSRIAGLGREVIASSFFGTSGAFSAFTIAFQLPALMRSLVADSALSAAFLPVFTELIEEGRKREAFQLASTLVWTATAVLGAATCFFVLAAGSVVPLFIGSGFTPQLVSLTAGLSKVLFPIVILLGVNGVLVGVLQAYGHFGWPAFAAVGWNLVTIMALLLLRPTFHGPEQLYAYAVGVLAGTVVQLAIAIAAVRRIDFRLTWHPDWRNPQIRQVLLLMLPVTIALGIVDADSLINSTLGTLVSDQTPRAVEAAFRVVMVPQGLVSIPVTTVMFPALARLSARGDAERLWRAVDSGLRQLLLLMLPAAALTIALATPIVRLIYQRGSFTAHSTTLVAQALVWFAVSLPFVAGNLLLTRTFFAIQRPWIAGRIAAVNLAVDVIVSLVLYRPLGISGLVLGTASASVVMLGLQLRSLRGELNVPRTENRTVSAVCRSIVACGLLGAVTWACGSILAGTLGHRLAAQIATVLGASAVGVLTYAGVAVVLRIPEAIDLANIAVSRVRSR